jgi:hypothetical protein
MIFSIYIYTINAIIISRKYPKTFGCPNVPAIRFSNPGFVYNPAPLNNCIYPTIAGIIDEAINNVIIYSKSFWEYIITYPVIYINKNENTLMSSLIEVNG